MEKGQETSAKDTGGSFWGSVLRVAFLLAAGTVGFYTLGGLSDRVKGIERRAEQARTRPNPGSVSAPTKPRPPAPSRPRLIMPKLPAMAACPGGHGETGGETFLLNGVPRRILTYACPASPTEVTEWYVKKWQEVNLTPSRQGDDTFAAATAMSMGDNLQYSVLAQRDGAGGETLVNASVSTIAPVSQEWKPTSLPLPPGSSNLMDMTSCDAGSPAAMVIYRCPVGTAETAQYLKDHLPEQGWRYEDLYSRLDTGTGTGMLFFTCEDRQLCLSLSRTGDKGTVVAVSESIDLQ